MTGHRQEIEQKDPLEMFDDPIEQFDEAVRRMMARTPSITRQQAVVAAAKKHPDLHRAFLLATNPVAGNRRRLMEKFEGEDVMRHKLGR